MPESKRSSEEVAPASQPRRLSGMLTIPIVFVWLFLRRGYAPSLRIAAFGYTATMTSIAVIGRSA